VPEHRGHLDRAEVQRIGKDVGEVFEPREVRGDAEGVPALDRLQHRLSGRPQKENKGHRQLRPQQQYRQQLARKDIAPLH